MNGDGSKELVILVPCKGIEFTIRGLLSVPNRIKMRPLREHQDYEIRHHYERDSGCRIDSHNFLKQYAKSYSKALVVFDREGCGSVQSREEIEDEVKGLLAISGWGERAEVVVIDPELEQWVWSRSRNVEKIIGWEGHTPSLREWLLQEGYTENAEQIKANNPQKAYVKAMQIVRKSKSSRIFEELAKTVSLSTCEDQAFIKLRNTMQTWFPPETNQ